MKIESNYLFKEHHDVNIIKIENIPSKKCIIICSLLSLLLLISIEVIIFIFLLFIIPFYIIIVIYVLLNLILLRYIMYSVIFPGKNSLGKYYMYKSYGKNRALLLYNSLENFKLDIDKITILSFGNNFNECDILDIENKPKISFKYIDIYLKIKEQYRYLNINENEFLNKLISLKTSIENSSLQLNYKKYKQKKTIYLSQKDINDYEKIKIEINNIQELLLEFRREKIINCKNIFNNLLSSQIFERISVYEKYPNSKVIEVNSCIATLDCLIIYSSKNPKKDENISYSNNIVIICGPNCIPFESIINKWNLDDLYLSNNVDIFLWSYRGYGFSNGSANFSACCKDILSIYDFLVTNYNYNKIFVHGLSIGGIPACYLATKRNIHLLIADRTFGSFKGILETFSCYKLLYFLSIILFIPSINNTDNFIKAKYKKIILNDPEDNTIQDNISLKTSISNKIIYDLFNIQKPELNPNNIRTTNIIDYVFGQECSNEIYNSFNITINSIKNNSNDISSNVDDDNEKDSSYNDNDKSHKINENQLIISSSITNNSIESLNNIKIKFDKKLDKLYSDFNSAGDNLISFENDNTLTHFNNFFNNLFVYGTEDFHQMDYSFCNINSVEQLLNNFIEEADAFLNNEEINQLSDSEIYKNFFIFLNFIKKLKKFMSDINIKKIEKEYFEGKKGELIPITCGHIDFYTQKEANSIKHIIKEVLNINENTNSCKA